MRILIATAMLPRREWDPQGSFILDQAMALAMRGHSLEFLVLERMGAEPHGPLAGLGTPTTVPYLPVPLRAGVGVWGASVRLQLRRVRRVFDSDFDVAVVHDELVALAVYPLLERARIPWMLVVHGENRSPAFSRPAGIRAKNDVYGRARAIISVGRGVELPLWTSSKAKCIPNGARVPDSTAPSPEKTANVMAVSVSGLREGKGIERNLQAMSRLTREGIDVGYWIVGDGPLRDRLEELSERLELDRRVHFLGSVSRTELGSILSAADFFSLPSNPEAFGIAHAEAMQAGLPVVACADEGPSAYITDKVEGFLVGGGTAELDDAWRSLCTNPELRAQMGARARQSAAPLTWKSNAEKLEKQLVELLDKNESPRPGRDLYWLGVEPTSYMLDSVSAIRTRFTDTRVAYTRGGGDISVGQLCSSLLRGRPKVLLMEGWGYPQMLLVMAMAICARVPFIVGSDSHEPVGGRRGVLREVVRALAIRPLVRRAAVLLPGGTPQARYVRELVQGDDPPLVVAHMTVDTAAFERSTMSLTRSARVRQRREWECGPNDVAVLFVGRLIASKGLPTLVDVMEQLQGDPIRLVVVGAGPLEGRLRSASDRLPIHLVGGLGKQELSIVYASADILVLPSTTEPWGLVVNEAMAAGLPCIVSDAVGCREDLIDPGETGWVFPSGDVQTLCQLLRTLSADEALRARVGSAARERMRDWSMDTYGASVARAVDIARTRVS